MKPFITEAFQDGKFVLPLQVEGIPADRVSVPFEDAFVHAYGLPESHSFQAAWLFRLMLSTGWIVDFSSACTEVGNWKEVGSLNLSFAPERESAESIRWLMAPLADFQVKTVERLIYEDADVYAECGIVLRDLLGREIIVAAGTAPGSVSIAGPFSVGPFQPEFAMTQYQRRRA